jgi:predicted dienelactone hydrolase
LLNNYKFRAGWLISLTIGAISVATSSVRAAERIELGIGPIKLGVSVKELENYAQQDRVSKDLNAFLGRIEESDRPYVRKSLTLKSGFSALQVSQFSHSALGNKILDYLGNLVQTDRNQNGAEDIRGGLIVAAGDPEGLSVLNFLRKYPSETIYLNLEKGFEVANKIEKLGQETMSAVAGVEKMSLRLAQSEPQIEPKMLASLAEAGQYLIKLETETLIDVRRNRSFIVDFYWPQGATRPAPVIVLSHGLGSDRQHFAALAKHLASYGFVAVTVEHPGSNLGKLQQLLNGSSKEVFDVSEFVDRPKDVSYVLDNLAQRFPGAVDVQKAGVIGHSFGGYTALALAGATVDFDYLTKQCSQGIDSANVSLLLQCEALKLPHQTYNFRDERIKFALAINPVDSSIFGPKGMAKIRIPVAIAAASDDAVASAVLEQIKPFSWISAAQRYLFVTKGVGHVADIRSLTRVFVPSFNSFISEQNTDPLQEYSNTFILALVQTHVRNQTTYRPYLQAGYAIAMSQTPHRVSMLRTLTPQQFDNLLVPNAAKNLRASSDR